MRTLAIQRRERGRRAEAFGRASEEIAERALARDGYTILATRQKTPYGEIDIVAQHGDVLVFVEVKSRKTIDDALHAITAKQWARLGEAAVYHTATLFPDDQGNAAPDLRFDVIAVDRAGQSAHIVNARAFDC